MQRTPVEWAAQTIQMNPAIRPRARSLDLNVLRPHLHSSLDDTYKLVDEKLGRSDLHTFLLRALLNSFTVQLAYNRVRRIAFGESIIRLLFRFTHLDANLLTLNAKRFDLIPHLVSAPAVLIRLTFDNFRVLLILLVLDEFDMLLLSQDLDIVDGFRVFERLEDLIEALLQLCRLRYHPQRRSDQQYPDAAHHQRRQGRHYPESRQ